MPRKPRSSIKEGHYHVIIRGNNRANIFFKSGSLGVCAKFFNRNPSVLCRAIERIVNDDTATQELQIIKGKLISQ